MRTRIEALFDEAPTETTDAAREEFPLPTLEQRINLYLMGVHGPRVHSSEERAVAREIVVSEIASNLFGPIEKTHDVEFLPQLDEDGVEDVAYSLNLEEISHPLRLDEEHSGFSGGFESKVAQRSEPLQTFVRVGDVPRAKLDEGALLSRLEGAMRSEIRSTINSEIRSSIDDVSHRMSELKAQRVYEDRISELISRLNQEREPPKPPNRWGFAAAATFAGCLIGVLATGGYHWFKGTAEPSAGVVAKLERSADGSIQRAEIRDLNLEMSWRLIKIAEDLIQERNVAGARAVLAEAAQIGSASAALALGATFDPNEIANDYRQRRDQANIQEARRWYQRAKELGSNAAQQRLDRLGN